MELTQKQRDRQHELAMKSCFYGGCAPVVNDFAECSGVHETCARHNKYFKLLVDIGIQSPNIRDIQECPDAMLKYMVQLEGKLHALTEELILKAATEDGLMAENGQLELAYEQSQEELRIVEEENRTLRKAIEEKNARIESYILSDKQASDTISDLNNELRNVREYWVREAEAGDKLIDLHREALEKVAQQFLDEREAHGQLAIEFLKHLKSNGKI